MTWLLAGVGVVLLLGVLLLCASRALVQAVTDWMDQS